LYQYEAVAHITRRRNLRIFLYIPADDGGECRNSAGIAVTYGVICVCGCLPGKRAVSSKITHGVVRKKAAARHNSLPGSFGGGKCRLMPARRAAVENSRLCRVVQIATWHVTLRACIQPKR